MIEKTKRFYMMMKNRSSLAAKPMKNIKRIENTIPSRMPHSLEAIEATILE
jgi:hypothetical protein